MNTSDAIKKVIENAGNEPKVFDWKLAAELIKRHKPTLAFAGLKEDWSNTCDIIYKNGNPVKSEYAFLASTWDIPVICFDKKVLECYKMQHEVPEWDAMTMWPKTALRILKEE